MSTTERSICPLVSRISLYIGIRDTSASFSVPALFEQREMGMMETLFTPMVGTWQFDSHGWGGAVATWSCGVTSSFLFSFLSQWSG